MIGISFSYEGVPKFTIDVYAERYQPLPNELDVAIAYGHMRRAIDAVLELDPFASTSVLLRHRPERMTTRGTARGVTQVVLVFYASFGDCLPGGEIHKRRSFRLRSLLDRFASQLITSYNEEAAR